MKRLSLLLISLLGSLSSAIQAETFRLPTPNQAIFEPGGESRYYVGTVGKPWSSGTFGCVRSDGWQMHEGIDIRCLQRDKQGEPVDPVVATADGVVAYINRRPGLSNYGNYIVLRHQLDGLEIFSIYAHLREIAHGLQEGKVVRAGEMIAVMGRTSNTRQGISRDRAHLHFELDVLASTQFSSWHKKNLPGQRNDHGEWNGRNLLALDPRDILLQQARQGSSFSLLNYIRRQPPLCRVLVRKTSFSWLKRNPGLVRPNPVAQREGVAGYELVLNFNGVPVQAIPRAASEIKSVGAEKKYALLAVQEAEYQKNPCRRLVVRPGKNWALTRKGTELLDLLTYQ